MRKPIIILFLFISSILLFSMQLCTMLFGSKPSINVTKPSNNQNITTTTVVIEGTIVDKDDDASYVKAWIYGHDAISGKDSDISNGIFSITLDLSSLSSGIFIICVQGFDKNKNESDIVSITINYSGSVGGSNYLVNGDFKDLNFKDNDIIYNNNTQVTNYLNKTNGDYLPNWTFYISSPEEDCPKIDIISDSVRMYTTASNSNGSAMGFYQNTSGVSALKTGTGLKINISFKIASFAGGNCAYQWFEAPIKITIKVGGNEYLIAAFTNKSGSSSGGFLKINLPIGTPHTYQFNIPSTTLNGENIPSNQQIEEFKITANGWTWDVTIYLVEIY